MWNLINLYAYNVYCRMLPRKDDSVVLYQSVHRSRFKFIFRENLNISDLGNKLQEPELACLFSFSNLNEQLEPEPIIFCLGPNKIYPAPQHWYRMNRCVDYGRRNLSKFTGSCCYKKSSFGVIAKICCHCVQCWGVGRSRDIYAESDVICLKSLKLKLSSWYR